jgi:hypothetical protein
MLFPVDDGYISRSSVRPGNRHLLFQAPRWIEFYCGKLATFNYGRVPFELERPLETFRDVLTELSSIPGLVDVTDIDPYTVGIAIGDMFDSGEVASRIARAFQVAFYPDEDLELVHSTHKDSDPDVESIHSPGKPNYESITTQPDRGGECSPCDPN